MTNSDAEKRKLGGKYDSESLFHEEYNYSMWSENKELIDKEELTDKEEHIDLFDMPPLEGDEEEGREGKRIRTLPSNKLLTTLPIL